MFVELFTGLFSCCSVCCMVVVFAGLRGCLFVFVGVCICVVYFGLFNCLFVCVFPGTRFAVMVVLSMCYCL